MLGATWILIDTFGDCVCAMNRTELRPFCATNPIARPIPRKAAMATCVHRTKADFGCRCDTRNDRICCRKILNRLKMLPTKRDAVDQRGTEVSLLRYSLRHGLFDTSSTCLSVPAVLIVLLPFAHHATRAHGTELANQRATTARTMTMTTATNTNTNETTITTTTTPNTATA